MGDAVLQGIATGSGVTNMGLPVSRADAFAAAASQIVAVIPVGAVDPGAILRVSWSLDDADGTARLLFTQQIPVRGYVHAFATALPHGGFPVGAYEVDASLGGHRASTLFVVDATVPAPRATAAATAPRVSAVAMVARGGMVELASTRAPVPDAVLDAVTPPLPTSGPTGFYTPFPFNPGAVPAPPPGTRPKPCSLSLAGDNLILFAADVELVGEGACGELVLAVSFDGGPKTEIARGGVPLTTTVVNAIPYGKQLFGHVFPCSLPGGSDVPPGFVTVYGEEVGHPELTQKEDIDIQDLGLPPAVVITGTPPDGTKVRAGSQIDVRVKAEGFPATSGIASITLTSNAGYTSTVKNPNNKKCTLGRYVALAMALIKVPGSPPPIFTITATASDAAGHVGGGSGGLTPAVLNYPTGDQWTGTMTADSSRAYIETDNGPYSCHDAWSGTLSFTVSTKNAVSGSGTLNLTSQNCDFPYGEPPPSPQVTFSVSGTRNANGFTLLLGAPKFADIPAKPTDAGIDSLLHDPSCNGTNPGPALLVPFTDPTHASGSPQVRIVMGAGCGGSAGHDVLTAAAAISLTKSGS